MQATNCDPFPEFTPNYLPPAGQMDWSWAFVIYKAVPGFDGYCVGTNGSLWTRLNKRWPGFSKRWRPVKPTLHTGDHYRAQLHKNKKMTAIGFHRLILQTFIGPCPPGMESCHNNGDPADNRLSNLRWDTRKANMKDRDQHGRTARGSRCGRSKLVEKDIPFIRSLLARGMTQKAVASIYGMDDSTICEIATGKIWGHVQ